MSSLSTGHLDRCQYVINRTRPFTEGFVGVDRASGVDSITDYNGFSREVAGVNLTLSFKAIFLFNCIIYLSVLQAVFTDVSAKINMHICYR